MDEGRKKALVTKAEDQCIEALLRVEAIDPAAASEILDGIGAGTASGILKVRKAADAWLAAR